MVGYEGRQWNAYCNNSVIRVQRGGGGGAEEGCSFACLGSLAIDTTKLNNLCLTICTARTNHSACRAKSTEKLDLWCSLC